MCCLSMISYRRVKFWGTSVNCSISIIGTEIHILIITRRRKEGKKDPNKLIKKLCVSLTDDPSWSTHMPAHALVTRRPRCPDPAAALACDRVTRSGQRPPRGTLTLLAAAACHLWVTMVTSSTPGQGDHGKKKRVHYWWAKVHKQEVRKKIPQH